jgi:hypothetical protein
MSVCAAAPFAAAQPLARGRFKDLEEAERQQPERRNAEEYPTVGMVLHGPQHTRRTKRDARIRIVIGDVQIAAEHEKHEAAGEDMRKARNAALVSAAARS